ncbi:AI-2E family transporter [Methylococcus geothermalis]|uniref:AI-2E family transporter n=1 Tax=Methylococcus geothermalis TaxID=2681310 RepID=A0A858Q585_9GAMM|nr:AI-2E family transporter [Methylococcus geothermalis]QJD28974.1 AI-2E family transporter [Methylococcus geothermalis]
MIQRENVETLLGYLGVGLMLVACYRVAEPFIGALTWAGIIVVSIGGLLDRAERLLRWPRKYLALALTLILGLIFVVPVVLLGSSFASHVHELIGWVDDLAARISRGPPAWLDQIPLIGAAIRDGWQTAIGDGGDLAVHIRPWIGEAGRWVVSRSAHFASAAFEALLAVLLSGLLYLHADAAIRWIRRTAEKIGGEKGARTIDVITRTVRGVTLGVMGIAFLQGVLIALGLAVAGVPGAMLLGFVSFILALAQLGSWPVWLPAAFWLGYQDHAAWGIALSVWGFALIVVDHFLKPYLISQGSGLPIVVIFMGVIGGLIAWGLIGIFLGAALLAVAYTLFKEWVEAD